MQYKQSLIVLLILLLPFFSFSQATTYLPQGAGENVLLERVEIKAGTDSVLNFSKLKPYSRKYIVPAIERYYSNAGTTETSSPGSTNEIYPTLTLSKVDRYNAELTLMKNNEWTTQTFASKRPFLKAFYKTPANAYEVHSKDFQLVLNPVFQYIIGKESNNSEHIFHNTRGITLRGSIASKVGFSAYITDNQERDPLYVQSYVNARQAVPGVGYYKNFKGTGYDYFDARGSISVTATKYIDISFGYDKNFIGNGYRSLFLSDFGNNALFLKLNTRIWKLNYQNLFMELVNAHGRGGDLYLDKKYVAIHHLDVGVTKWLNVGLFEGIVFGRTNHFEFGYLNPVIFYRSAEQQNGSFDNALAGLDAKANVAHHLQLYGQFLLDEFKLSELKKKWWGNKFGLQAGVKYIDAFGVSNLDLQAELNRVRPFTYSHYDSVANYTHDNLPLAHPLGANFNEFLGSLRYQFAPQWTFLAKAMFYKQGRDVDSVSYGSNIFLPNGAPYRTSEYGYEVGSGALAKVGYGSLLLSYEWKPNLYFEGSAVFRKQNAYTNSPSQNTTVVYIGIRWNMHRRDFEF